MAFSTTTHEITYAGNGSISTAYTIPFPFLLTSHIKVAVSEDGVEEPVDLADSAYTVTRLEDGSGGSVTTASAVTSPAEVLIYREVPLTQPTVFQLAGPFPSTDAEKAFDRATMQIQQLEERIVSVESFEVPEGGYSGAFAVLQKPNGIATEYVQAADTNAARETALRVAVRAAATGDMVLTGVGASTVSGPFIDELSVGVTGVKLVLGPRTQLFYTDRDHAAADRALFSGIDRNPYNFGTVTNTASASAAARNLLAHECARMSGVLIDATLDHGGMPACAVVLDYQGDPAASAGQTLYYLNAPLRIGSHVHMKSRAGVSTVHLANYAPDAGTLQAGTWSAEIGTTFTKADHGLAKGQRVRLEALSLNVAGTAVIQTFTAVAATDVVTLGENVTSLGLKNGDIARLTTTDTLPGGLPLSTDCFVINRTRSTCKLSLTSGGAAIDITSAGTGTHTLTQSAVLADVDYYVNVIGKDTFELYNDPCIALSNRVAVTVAGTGQLREMSRDAVIVDAIEGANTVFNARLEDMEINCQATGNDGFCIASWQGAQRCHISNIAGGWYERGIYMAPGTSQTSPVSLWLPCHQTSTTRRKVALHLDGVNNVCFGDVSLPGTGTANTATNWCGDLIPSLYISNSHHVTFDTVNSEAQNCGALIDWSTGVRIRTLVQTGLAAASSYSLLLRGTCFDCGADSIRTAFTSDHWRDFSNLLSNSLACGVGLSLQPASYVQRVAAGTVEGLGVHSKGNIQATIGSVASLLGGSTCYVHAYNYDASAYLPLILQGLTVSVGVAGVSVATFGATTLSASGLTATFASVVCASGSFNGTLLNLGGAGVGTGIIQLEGTTSGTVTLQVAAAAGTWAATLPTAAPPVDDWVLSGKTTGVMSWVAPGGGGGGVTGTYTTGLGPTANGTITVIDGIVTAVTQAS